MGSSYAQSTFTAIFNLFLVALKLAEALSFFELHTINRAIFVKVGLSLISLLSPVGTPLMFSRGTYRFSACSLKRFTL